MDEHPPPVAYPKMDIPGLHRSVLTLIDSVTQMNIRINDLRAAQQEIIISERSGAAPTSWLGPWSASLEYLRGDIVSNEKWLLVANKTTTDTAIPNSPDWDVMAISWSTSGDMPLTEAADVLAFDGVVV
jgi:hypothetical protein